LSPTPDPSSLFIVLGNQLFPFGRLSAHRQRPFFMAEDLGLCAYVRHHRQKIVLFLAAMRSYRDELRRRGCDVTYASIEDEDGRNAGYEEKLERFLHGRAIRQLITWEVEDKFFEQRLRDFATSNSLELTFLPSPMFLTPRRVFSDWLDEHAPHMANFYKWQRRRLGILVDKGDPVGGQWSFDTENRRSLPKGLRIPAPPCAPPTQHVQDLIPLVNERFSDHPGSLSEAEWWLPTTRRQALTLLQQFLEERFADFGPFEDALSGRSPVLFHSVLTPALNMGLLTPDEILDRAMRHADENAIPMNSLEGFVRQIIGWREFVRGVYQNFSERQDSTNFFGHTRRLGAAWYEGATGLRPLDDVIRKALRYGWTHHIERLMVAANLMTLCEIEPREAHRWFMEMYVDSSDWVMGPNVYGMGIFSDGGVFATKPYICGSNYILKMSDASSTSGGPLFNGGNDWRHIMDGLYWRFIDKHRVFFKGNARMGQAVATFDKMKPERWKQIRTAAEAFLDRVTR